MKKTLYLLILAGLITAGCKTSKSDKESPGTQQDSLETVSQDTSGTPVVAQKLSGNDDVSDLQHVSGTLNYSGNEPFARPTIFVSDTVSFILEADETFLDSTYSSLNGKQATLYGQKKENGAMKTFKIYYYEIREE